MIGHKNYEFNQNRIKPSITSITYDHKIKIDKLKTELKIFYGKLTEFFTQHSNESSNESELEVFISNIVNICSILNERRNKLNLELDKGQGLQTQSEIIALYELEIQILTSFLKDSKPFTERDLENFFKGHKALMTKASKFYVDDNEVMFNNIKELLNQIETLFDSTFSGSKFKDENNKYNYNKNQILSIIHSKHLEIPQAKALNKRTVPDESKSNDNIPVVNKTTGFKEIGRGAYGVVFGNGETVFKIYHRAAGFMFGYNTIEEEMRAEAARLNEANKALGVDHTQEVVKIRLESGREPIWALQSQQRKIVPYLTNYSIQGIKQKLANQYLKMCDFESNLGVMDSGEPVILDGGNILKQNPDEPISPRSEMLKIYYPHLA